jgi:hypothetical protein
MPEEITTDTPQQRAAWGRFEDGAHAALEMLHGFGAGRRVVTLALIRLLLADLEGSDDGHTRH